jgi:hypothetical protein
MESDVHAAYLVVEVLGYCVRPEARGGGDARQSRVGKIYHDCWKDDGSLFEISASCVVH